jgi:hypothetical protein
VNGEDSRADTLVRAVRQLGSVEERNGSGDVAVLEVVGIEPGQRHHH